MLIAGGSHSASRRLVQQGSPDAICQENIQGTAAMASQLINASYEAGICSDLLARTAGSYVGRVNCLRNSMTSYVPYNQLIVGDIVCIT